MGGTGQRESSESCTGLLNGEACGEVAGVITATAPLGPTVGRGKDMDPGPDGTEELLSSSAEELLLREPMEKSAGTDGDANDEANSQAHTWPWWWERQPQSSMLG